MRAVCCAYLDKFVMLNFVAVPLKFATLCRFVAKLATPPPCVLRFAEFSAPCHAPLRHKSTLCHAIPRAKFSPHAQPPRSKALRYDDTKHLQKLPNLQHLLSKFVHFKFEFMTLKL